jgi:hypothetical protein
MKKSHKKIRTKPFICGIIQSEKNAPMQGAVFAERLNVMRRLTGVSYCVIKTSHLQFSA